MNGNAIGGSGTNAITNLNFESGTLKNVSEINAGAMLMKISDGSLSGGTLILAGTTNGYSGGTTVSAGTLVAANTSSSGSATGSGPVGVGSGATLSGPSATGQGFITGLVTVNSNGTLAANNSAAATTLTLSGGLMLGGSSTAAFTLNSSAPNGTSAPPVNVGGAILNVAGPSTVNIAFSSNAAVALGQTYDLFGYGSGSSASAPPTPPARRSATSR